MLMIMCQNYSYCQSIKQKKKSRSKKINLYIILLFKNIMAVVLKHGIEKALGLQVADSVKIFKM